MRSPGGCHPRDVIGNALRRVHGNAIVLSHLPGQRRLPYLPLEEMTAQRDARVRRMVGYAARTVPFYRELFRRRGLDPRDIRSAADLVHLPLLDKELIREQSDSFLSASRHGRRAIPFLTSGTTGAPLTVHHDLRSLLANIAFGEREREVITTMCGRSARYREAYITYRHATVRHVWALYRERTLIPVRPDRLALSVEDSVDTIVARLNAFQPHVLVGYGSYLEMLFRIVAARGLAMHRPRMLLYGGDEMTEPGRRFIEQEFRVPVHSHYDAVEALKIGFTCEVGRGFHLHEDLSPVHLVDASGRRVPDGEPGEVVISNLVNRGTVLLNYRLGDVGVMSRDRCPCGRTLPLLAELQGRVEDILVLPDGRLLHPRAVWGVFKAAANVADVLRFQLVQHATDRFELRLATRDRPIYDRLVPGLLHDFRGLLGPVTIEPVFTIDWGPQELGKFRPVLSLCRRVP